MSKQKRGLKTRLVGLYLIIGMLGIQTAFAQIPPNYYQSAQGLSGEDLKAALHDIIDNHDEYSYNALRDYILKDTDQDPNNSNNVILLYTGRSEPKSNFGGGANQWNREHVWAKSHGDFGNDAPAGTDAHHIRPCDGSVNSSRGNKDFDNGGNPHSEATGCFSDSDSWEPRDAVKGDVARMLFYMAVRYEGGSGEPDLELVDYVNSSPSHQPYHGKLSALLEWHEQDPPDDFEIRRNNRVYHYQDNRNPFIDHPEYVEMIWGTTAGINDRKELIKLKKWQNNGHIFMEFEEGHDHTMNIFVFNVQGQIMEQSTIQKGQSSWNSKKSLNAGIYSIIITSDSKKLSTQRIVIL